MTESGRRCSTALSRASSTSSVRRCPAIAQPVPAKAGIRRLSTSRTMARDRNPARVGTSVMSATHSRSGASAWNSRSTQSCAGRAWALRRVVRGPLRRLTPAKPAWRIPRATRLARSPPGPARPARPECAAPCRPCPPVDCLPGQAPWKRGAVSMSAWWIPPPQRVRCPRNRVNSTWIPAVQRTGPEQGAGGMGLGVPGAEHQAPATASGGVRVPARQ